MNDEITVPGFCEGWNGTGHHASRTTIIHRRDGTIITLCPECIENLRNDYTQKQSPKQQELWDLTNSEEKSGTPEEAGMELIGGKNNDQDL